MCLKFTGKNKRTEENTQQVSHFSSWGSNKRILVRTHHSIHIPYKFLSIVHEHITQTITRLYRVILTYTTWRQADKTRLQQRIKLHLQISHRFLQQMPQSTTWEPELVCLLNFLYQNVSVGIGIDTILSTSFNINFLPQFVTGKEAIMMINRKKTTQKKTCDDDV